MSPTLAFLLAGLALSDFLAGIDSTATVIALPRLAEQFSLSTNAVSVFQIVYILALVITLIPAGSVGDHRGHKRVFLTGLTLFAAASVGLVFSNDFLLAVLFRALQGIAAGMLYTASGALIAHAWKKTETAFGVTAAIFSLGLLIGPVFGGMLSDAHIGAYQGWHLIFAINIPVAVISYWLVRRNAAETPAKESAGHFDWLGLTYLAACLGSFILLLMQPVGRTWLLLAFLIAVILLVRQERTTSVPLVTPKLFANRTFRAVSVFAAATMLAVMAFNLINSFYLQDVLGNSATNAGLMMLPISIGMGVFSVVAGSFRNWRVGAVTGGMLIAAGILGIRLITPETPYWQGLFWCYLVLSAGGGFMMTNTFAAAMGSVSTQLSGAAAGTINTMQQLGSLAGVALAGGQNILSRYGTIYDELLVVIVLGIAAALFIRNPAPEIADPPH